MRQQKTRNRLRASVGISGSYGGLNLGDEAILESIISSLRSVLDAHITVLSRDPGDTLKRHPGVEAVPVRQLSRAEMKPLIQRLDLMIIGGGGILFDEEAHLYLREAQIAAELGVPVMFWAIGAGPLVTPEARELVRRCAENAQAFTVRERRARQLLEDVGVQRTIEVTADPALLLRPAPLSPGRLAREGISGRKRLIGMSVREPGGAAPDISDGHYHGLMANAADYMVDRFDADIVFVPMERRVLDLQQSHAVVSQMLRPHRAVVLKEEYTAGQLLSLLGRFEFAVGMRLHFLIFSALAGVPFVALSYAPKVSGFLESIPLQMPPLKQVNTGRLIAHIDESWDRRRSLKARLARAVPQLKTQAKLNLEIAIRLLREGSKLP